MKLVQYIKTIYGNRPLLFLMLVNVLFMAIVILLLPFQYGTGDDRLMAWTASGYLSGTFDFHTLYMNVIYSWVESRLYMLMPNVEWHTWLFLVIHVICLSVIANIILTSANRRMVKLALVLMLYFLEIGFLTHLQFTTTAGMAATAGMMLVVLKKRYLLGVLLFLLGALVRYPSAMLCGLMTTALYPLTVVRFGFDKCQFVALFLSAVGAFGLQHIDGYVYMKNPKWKEIYEYDRLRGKLHDNSNIWRLYGNFPEGITEERFNSWVGIIDYKDVLSVEEIEACMDVIEFDTAYHGIPGVKKVKNIPRQLFGLWPWFLVLAVLVMGGVLNCDNRKERVALVLGVLCFPLAMVIVVLNVRMMERAFLCGWLPMAMLVTNLLVYNKKGTEAFPVLAALMVIVFVVMKASSQDWACRGKYRQDAELVRKGEHQGVRFFVVDIVSWNAYPFGIRYHFKNKDAKLISLKDASVEMVDDEDYAFLVDRGTMGTLVQDMDLLMHLQCDNSKMVVSQEIGDDDSYVLFSLVGK